MVFCEKSVVKIEIFTTPVKHEKGLSGQAEGHQPSLKLWRGKRKITENEIIRNGFYYRLLGTRINTDKHR